MINKPKRLSTKQIHTNFVCDIGDDYVLLSDLETKPLLISNKNAPDIIYKVYVYNCTNPPGGRQIDEYKIQLKIPGQHEKERGFLDETDGTIILLVGFANYDTEENGVWIIWETKRHMSFAYNANLQVKMGMLIDTITKKVFYVKKRGNGETVVVSDRKNLSAAIKLREKIDLGIL